MAKNGYVFPTFEPEFKLNLIVQLEIEAIYFYKLI